MSMYDPQKAFEERLAENTARKIELERQQQQRAKSPRPAPVKRRRVAPTAPKGTRASRLDQISVPDPKNPKQRILTRQFATRPSIITSEAMPEVYPKPRPGTNIQDVIHGGDPDPTMSETHPIHRPSTGQRVAQDNITEYRRDLAQKNRRERGGLSPIPDENVRARVRAGLPGIPDEQLAQEVRAIRESMRGLTSIPEGNPAAQNKGAWHRKYGAQMPFAGEYPEEEELGKQRGITRRGGMGGAGARGIIGAFIEPLLLSGIAGVREDVDMRDVLELLKERYGLLSYPGKPGPIA